MSNYADGDAAPLEHHMASDSGHWNDAMPHPTEAALLRRIRWMMAIAILGLVVSGVTAFPLESELRWLTGALNIGAAADEPAGGLRAWLATVRDALIDVGDRYPFLAYGTDWLAFAHLVLAVFFVGPLVDPRRNVWVVVAGLIACGGVLLLALIAGPVRGIPLGWRLIDCSFGVLCAVPLGLALVWIRRLERLAPRRA